MLMSISVIVTDLPLFCFVFLGFFCFFSFFYENSRTNSSLVGVIALMKTSCTCVILFKELLDFV